MNLLCSQYPKGDFFRAVQCDMAHRYWMIASRLEQAGKLEQSLIAREHAMRCFPYADEFWIVM